MSNELQSELPSEASQIPPFVELRQVVEALLFAAPKPMTARQIANLLNKSNETHGTHFHLFREVPEDRIEEIVAELAEEYRQQSRGVVVQQLAGGYRFGTRPETATWVRQLFDETRPSKLSQPALETLAIIAYRQPISRADIEAVRGVAVDGVVTTLLERRFIKLAGRSDAPGRPLLYETTAEFLECFGLKHLDELPNADELRHIQLRVAPTPAAPAQPTGETVAVAEEAPVSPDAAAAAESPAEDAATADSSVAHAEPAQEENASESEPLPEEETQDDFSSSDKASEETEPGETDEAR